jgi:hypothetical protein
VIKKIKIKRVEYLFFISSSKPETEVKNSLSSIWLYTRKIRIASTTKKEIKITQFVLNYLY